jgi:ankyrin repeat protein
LIISVIELDQPLKGLLEKSLEDDQTSRAVRLLYHVAYLGLYWTCKILIENGADVNMQGGLWGSPLQAASSMDHENTVQLLLDHGADVNIQGGRLHRSPFDAAIKYGREHTFLRLVDHGADIRTQIGYYDKVLLWNAWSLKIDPDVAVILLQHGAVMSKFHGGIEAEEELARKDFKRFIAIQMEAKKLEKKNGIITHQNAELLGQLF